jgi:AraC-like DNA-binding protein
MKVFNLPQDLLPAGYPPDEIVIKRYTSATNTIKNKIILHQNMINLLIEGQKTISHTDNSTTVHEDEILMLSCGNCLTTEVLSGLGKFHSIIIYFSNKLMADFYVKYTTLISRRKEATGQPSLTFKKDTFIRNYITSLDLLLQSNEHLSPELKLLKLEELMVYLFETNSDAVASFRISTISEEKDLALRQVVETNITSNITVEEMAFLCNASVSTFQRRFNAVYGLSPQKWLLEQKLQLAARLLQQPGEKPSDVYLKVGYENHSSFSKSFKQQFGISPKEFQEQHLTM